jgi:hypothetical protein
MAAQWGELTAGDLAPIVDLMCVFLYFGCRSPRFVEALLRNIGEVELNNETMQVVIRLRAALYLAVGHPLGDIIEGWVEMVQAGWFSTMPYLSILSQLCFRRLIGEGLGQLAEFLGILENSVDQGSEAAFAPPPGMEDFLAPYMSA